MSAGLERSASRPVSPHIGRKGAIDRVVARYAGASHFDRGFVRGKLRGDPAVEAILALATRHPFGHVADLGCGRGQFGLLLLEEGLAERVCGFDLDERKIALANAAARQSPPRAEARFSVADLVTARVDDCDTVLLIDVLLLMPDQAQDALLTHIAQVARRRVVIRAFDPDRGWRSRIGTIAERLRCLLGADRAGNGIVRPRPIETLTAPLRAAGYAVSVQPCWGSTPLPNVLIVAERNG